MLRSVSIALHCPHNLEVFHGIELSKVIFFFLIALVFFVIRAEKKKG